MYLIEITYDPKHSGELKKLDTGCAFFDHALSIAGTVLCAKKQDGSGWIVMANSVTREQIEDILNCDVLVKDGYASYRLVELESTRFNSTYSELAEIKILEEFMMEGLKQPL